MNIDAMRRNIYPMTDWNKFLKEAKVEFFELYNLDVNEDLTLKDFELLKKLGQGAFGKVYLTKHIKTGTITAMKLIDKKLVHKKKMLKHIKGEKKILQGLNFPFTVSMAFSFVDDVNYYFAMPFIKLGEMFPLLRKMKKFSEKLSKFYGAQVLLAFEYLHYCNLIYRDLKPENLLIDADGYCKVTDFGFCKVIVDRTYTHCGTPEYQAPEIILSLGYGKSVDWWAYGILLYEMNAGFPPFRGKDVMKTYERVVSGRYDFPKFFSKELKNLIENILQVDVTRRFGNLKNGVKDIKYHPWFKDTNYVSLFNHKVEPPYMPEEKDKEPEKADKYAIPEQ